MNWVETSWYSRKKMDQFKCLCNDKRQFLSSLTITNIQGYQLLYPIFSNILIYL
jgi:hypothetical protein